MGGLRAGGRAGAAQWRPRAHSVSSGGRSASHSISVGRGPSRATVCSYSAHTSGATGPSWVSMRSSTSPKRRRLWPARCNCQTRSAGSACQIGIRVPAVVAGADVQVVDVQQDAAVGALRNRGQKLRFGERGVGVFEVGRHVLDQNLPAERVLHDADARHHQVQRLLRYTAAAAVRSGAARPLRPSTGGPTPAPARSAPPARAGGAGGRPAARSSPATGPPRAGSAGSWRGPVRDSAAAGRRRRSSSRCGPR